MAMTRVKYGVEFGTRREERGTGSSHVGWIIVLVILLAAGSFVIHVIRRISTAQDAAGGPGDEPSLVVESLPAAPSEAAARASEAATMEEEVRPVVVNDFGGRPSRAKALLLRLDVASDKNDIEMQVSTIEQLRALPGGAVADIDDKLVRLLGELNMRRLFELSNPQWVTEVTVKRGDSATRIAQEHGSTLGSLKRLNASVNLDRLQIGTKLKVMKKPAFTLIVHKKQRSVELMLNDRLFKRYDLPEGAPEIPMEPGAYRTPANLRDFFRREGIGLSPEDAAEIDLLVPRDQPVRVSAA